MTNYLCSTLTVDGNAIATLAGSFAGAAITVLGTVYLATKKARAERRNECSQIDEAAATALSALPDQPHPSKLSDEEWMTFPLEVMIALGKVAIVIPIFEEALIGAHQLSLLERGILRSIVIDFKRLDELIEIKETQVDAKHYGYRVFAICSLLVGGLHKLRKALL